MRRVSLDGSGKSYMVSTVGFVFDNLVSSHIKNATMIQPGLDLVCVLVAPTKNGWEQEVRDSYTG